MQETGSVNQFIKPEGSLCLEASGNAETGAQAGSLSTSARSGTQNKAAQETEGKKLQAELLFIDTRSAGLGTLSCQKRNWNLPPCKHWSPENTKWQRTVVPVCTLKNLLEAERSKNFPF